MLFAIFSCSEINVMPSGVLTILYMVIAVAAHSLDSILSGKVHPRWSQRQLWMNDSITDIMQAVPIIMFAFTCQVSTSFLWVMSFRLIKLRSS